MGLRFETSEAVVGPSSCWYSRILRFFSERVSNLRGAWTLISSLQTGRLFLRLFRPEDIVPYFQILNREETLRYFPGSTAPTEAGTRDAILRALGHWEARGYGLWAIQSLETGALLGRTGLQYITETDEVEVDFIVDRSVWGKGVATEAARAALRFGFDRLDVDEIVGIVHPDNLASRRVLEKVGMDLSREEPYFGMPCCRYRIERVTQSELSTIPSSKDL